MVIWRYTPDGDLDTTFGTNGIVVHDPAQQEGQTSSDQRLFPRHRLLRTVS